MGERKHETENVKKKNSRTPGPKESIRFIHPILQLQQTMGNRAVTKIIQRHPQEMMERYNWWVDDIYSGWGPAWLGTGSGRRHTQEAHEQRHAAQGAHEQRHTQEQPEHSHQK